MEGRMKGQHDPFEDAGLIAEVAGRPLEPTPMTEGQEAKLALWDQKVDGWIEGIDKAMNRDKEFKEYMNRTHDLSKL